MAVAGKRPLDRRRLAMFKQLVELYRDDLVHKWIDFFTVHCFSSRLLKC